MNIFQYGYGHIVGTATTLVTYRFMGGPGADWQFIFICGTLIMVMLLERNDRNKIPVKTQL